MARDVAIEGCPKVTTYPIPESEQLQWTQDASTGFWHGTGGASGLHDYTAIDLGEDSNVPHCPWYLRRSDGLYCRVTNFERVKDIAELWEQGLWPPKPAADYIGVERR